MTPDLCTLGKIVGGGFALSAIAGRADIMAHFDRGLVGDDGFLMQVGTLSGNPLGMAAGLASLRVMARPGAYEGMAAMGERLAGAVRYAAGRHGVPVQAAAVGAGLPSRDPAHFARLFREELARVVEQRRADDPNLHLVDGLAMYGPDDVAAHPLPDALHPDEETHGLMGDRFARTVFGGGGPFPTT